MNQHLILKSMAAAAALVVTATAQAETKNVEVYGIVDASLRSANNVPGGVGSTSVEDGMYTGSRIGFRGSRETASGMGAFFSLEAGYDPGNGTSQQSSATAGTGQGATTGGRLFGREALVGLKTTAGDISFGRQYTLAHTLSGRFQPQSNPNAASLSVLSGHHLARQDNMVKYAKTLGAVSVYATFTANEGNGKGSGIGASYKGKGYELVAYASDMKTTVDGADTRKIKGLGGNFTVTNDLTAYVGAMTRTQAVSTQKNTVTTFGANYKLSPTWVLTGGYTDDNQTVKSAGHRKVTFLGANYLLDKDTDVYFVVDNNKVDGQYAIPAFMKTRGTQTGYNVGIRYKF